MIKLFSVARRDDPSQPRPAVYAGRAEHITDIATQGATQESEPVSPSRAPHEPWWREVQRASTAEVFRRAVAGDLPNKLHLESVVALAGLTFEGMADKRTTDGVRWRLSRLVEAGWLQPDSDGLISREGVTAVWPELALPERGALALWAGKTASVATTRGLLKPVSTPTPKRCRGVGAETASINRAIQDATSRLEAGGIDWSGVPRATFARWLCRAGGPLAGQNAETIRSSYLGRKGLADPACPAGRQGSGAEDEAFTSLDAAWQRAETTNRDSFAPIRLAARR